MVTQLQLNKAL